MKASRLYTVNFTIAQPADHRLQKMVDSFQSGSHQAGVSLIELLVVIVVIAIMAGFALIQRGGANEQLTRQNTAQQLKTAFERARFDSVKRRAECEVNKAKVVVNTDSFALWIDKDMNGTPESGEVETTNMVGQNITIDGISLRLPATVSFNQRGEVTANDGATTTTFPGFLVCNGSCSVSPTNRDANKVYVTPTGTVNMLGGNQVPPTFGAPGGTAISTGLEINDNMLLSTVAGCS
ncbi:MAG TPA: prepilin-type N-terminal cleavage/methylation domain-containing protein [Pyrinomonadaceae bacterium]|nr:prepilin-type N-terminal cleavage/methylation domain-containing protein [Pyrinomonadaceae bacterium]